MYFETLRWTNIAAAPFVNPLPFSQHGTFVLEMLDKKFQCPIFAHNSRGEGSLSISASLKATEYFEYDPNDGGGPIYDKTTGSALRGFS